MKFDYATIKRLAKENGCRITDLIALASQNDPFYVGRPAAKALGEWFAGFYHNNFPRGAVVHLRACHYKVLSLELLLPSGEPYLNTERCWDTIVDAAKYARYLKLVDFDLIRDNKNAVPISYSPEPPAELEIGVSDDATTDLPDLPALPGYWLDGGRVEQPYHVELWCEKTTMNDILLALCQQYHCTLQTGQGELSITATKDLAKRINQSGGKPARILYISDYDPAGLSMPVAVARKLEYFVRDNELDVDIKLFPVVLTAEQVRRYSLPRTPIKESEQRKATFEASHGEGATELDALEALRPGELARILRGYIESYYDPTLEQRSDAVRSELTSDLTAITRRVYEQHTGEIERLRRELEQLRQEPRWRAYADRVQAVWEAMSSELEAEMPELDGYSLPVARAARELGPGLYNSERDYLDQIVAYKQFQRK